METWETAVLGTMLTVEALLKRFQRETISNWTTEQSGDILANNLAAFCHCPKNLHEAKFKSNEIEAGETWVPRTLTTSPKNLGSILNNHMAAHNVYNSTLGNLTSSSSFLGCQKCTWYIHIHVGKNTHTHTQRGGGLSLVDTDEIGFRRKDEWLVSTRQ